MPFKKGESGNPNGRKKGEPILRTKQWDALGESIIGQQAENFNKFLNDLWSGNTKDKYLAADLYMKSLEYFKPKQSRVEARIDGEQDITVRIIKE